MGHADFQLASGGVIGRDHRQTFRNYQDARLVLRTARYSLAIVADGCGSGEHSEVGAATGVKLVAESVDHELATRGMSRFSWSRVQRRVLTRLDLFADWLGGNYRQTVENYLLFTINGILLTDELAIFFALGDGIVVVNDQVRNLGPFPGNMPPYLGYALISDRLNIDPAMIQLRPIQEKPLSEVDHFLLGSDGIGDFIAAADKTLPGLSTHCGEISQFWTQDRFFTGNPDLISRTLRLAGRDWPKRDPVPGLLPDDTTLVVGRRQPSEGGDAL